MDFSEQEQEKLNVYLLSNPRPGNVWITLEQEKRIEILIVVEVLDDDVFICDNKSDTEEKWEFSTIIVINKIELKNRLTYLKHGVSHFVANVIPTPDKCRFILDKYKSLKCNDKIKYVTETDNRFNNRMLKFIDSDFKNIIYKIRLLRFDEVDLFFKITEFEKLYQYLFNKYDE